MICTFGDITDVIWWRELALPVRAMHPAERHAAAGDVGRARLGVGRRRRARSAHYDQLAGPVRGQGAHADRRAAAGERRPVGEPRPITHAVKFYEKGDRPLEIVTSRQWFIKTMEFRERAARARPRAALASAVHAGALRELGQRPDRRLVRQPPALLRRAVPGLVSARRATAPSIYDAADRRATRSSCRSIRRPTCPTATAPSSAAQPGGFAGDPDVMDTWATSSLTPQIVGGWEDDPDLFARVVPDGPAPAGARHHPHLAVLHGAALAARARLAAVDERGDLRLGARSRPQEDVEVEGQRRHADGAARGARLRRRALLGGERPAGHRHGVRPEPDEGRPAARDQAAERVEVRARRPAEPQGDR